MSKPFLQIKPFFFAVFIFCAAAAWLNASDEPPVPRPHVVDQADLLSSKTKKMLETILSDFEQDTTHEIFVATFATLGDETAESFGNRLADEWKIGYKDLGNGVILLIFKQEHQARLEVGAGLDRRIPFPFRKELIDQELAPYFRSHQYDTGVAEAIRKIIIKVDPLYRLPNENWEPELPFWKKIIFGCLLAFLISLILDMISYRIYLNEILEHPKSAYQKRIGKYSFFEWWLIYGFPTTAFEYIYYRLFILWFNPSWLITSRGARRILLAGKTGRGRFWGNGTAGRW